MECPTVRPLSCMQLVQRMVIGHSIIIKVCSELPPYTCQLSRPTLEGQSLFLAYCPTFFDLVPLFQCHKFKFCIFDPKF